MPNLSSAGCLVRRQGNGKPLFITSVFTLIIPFQMAAQAPSSLPMSGNFSAGAGKITAAGNLMTINQSTQRAIVDWTSFSIGAGGAVNFSNGSGATLNRVTGGTASSIFGQLSASGSVYLINPQGVLIGHGAAVHTGGDFLVSTLSVSSSAFLGSGSLVFSGSSPATVVNLGAITSSGGSIYLIGHSVQNGGTLSSANGTTGLAAGSEVLISNGSAQRVAVQAPGGDVTNSGFISAAQVELKSNGGNIYALAGNNGGQINATGTATQDGRVWLVTANGNANISGLLSATNANGTGGTIETSGAHVSTSGATIKTGKGGNWLLDPDDLLINSALAGTIESSLNGGTNVNQQTGNGNSGNGDITVASSIAWASAASLTLSAFRNIGVNSGVTILNTGSGNLTLRADNTSNGIGTISFAGTGKIDFANGTGNVSLLYNPSSYSSPSNYASNFGAVNGAWAAPADGSISSQYTAYMLVNSPANLQNINSNAGGTYALGKDIDISSISNFTPLGVASPYFTGIFDGQGHTISGLTITDTNGTNLLGLFARTGSSAQLRNLNLTNINVTEAGTNATSLSGLAAINSGTISNVSVSGTVHGGSSVNDAGGLTANNTGTIQNSSSSVIINAAAATNGPNIGGLSGENSGTIINSFATGSANAPSGTGPLVGGLVGYNNGTLSLDYATGSLSGGAASAVGGLAGRNDLTITNSYASGAVSGGANSYIGGLVGLLNGGSVANSYSTGNVSGTADYAGGLVGYGQGASPISSSYATGNVTNTGAYVGGLIGFAQGSITASYATGTVTGSGTGVQVGGLAGVSSAAITGSYAAGAVSSPSLNAVVGGLVGQDTTGSITNSDATGNVTATNGAQYVGGLVGYNDVPIVNSYATGNVHAGASTYAGGLAGISDVGGTITSSHATGSVAVGTYSNAGGLVGRSNDAVTNSYATGAVTGVDSSNLGGLAGYSNASIATSYALGPVTGTQNSAIGGLAGDASSSISDSYANGIVTDNSTGAGTGGLVGALESTGTISRSYASGQVVASGSLRGGLVGYNSGSSNITSSYWDNQASGLSTMGVGSGNSSGVTGLTTAQLQNGSLPAGFNATNSAWTAPAGGYPYLGWQGLAITINGSAYSGSTLIASTGVGVLSGGTSLATLTTNSSGVYSIVEPANMVSSGVLTYLISNGAANTFADGSTGYSGMDLHIGSLSLISGYSSTLSSVSAAIGKTLGSNVNSNLLFTLPGGQLNLTAGTALSLASSAASFTLDQPITGAGNIYINSSGNLTIANGAGLTAASGSNITLVSSGAFTNGAGASALAVSGSGHWLVYSQNPVNDSTGGLVPAYKQYDAAYGITAPAQAGNGLLYTLAPVITPSLTGAITKVYDGTTAATLSAGNLALTGVVSGDAVSVTAGASAYADSNVNAGIAVTASSFGITASNGGIPVYGYQLANSSATANIGSITPATLTYISDSTSRAAGVANATFSGSVTGFVDNQTLASATSGAAIFTSPADTGSPAGSYAINGSGLTANQGNYVFIQAAGNASALTVTAAIPAPAPISTPPPTAVQASTPITIVIRNTTVLDTQTPAFSAVYAGPLINGIDIASLLAGLTYQINPSLDGPGTYHVTAAGSVPAGYVLNVLPATFTVVDSSPTALPTQANLFAVELPTLLETPESLSDEFLLLPTNALGSFVISAVSQSDVFGSNHGTLAQSLFFAGSNEKPAAFAAGVKP